MSKYRNSPEILAGTPKSAEKNMKNSAIASFQGEQSAHQVSKQVTKLVFAGSVLWTEKIHRTELNRTMVRSIFRLRLPKFGVILVAGCLISKIIQNRSKTS